MRGVNKGVVQNFNFFSIWDQSQKLGESGIHFCDKQVS